MNTGRLVTAVTAGFALPALSLGSALGLTPPAGAATTPAAAARAVPADRTVAMGTRTVAIDCQGKAVVRPRSYTLACADGNDYLSKLTWTSWTPKLASGYGTEQLNDCQPNCAEGRFHAYPVLTVFWGSAAVPGHPRERRYTEITLVYTGARPEVYNGHKWVPAPVTRTESLWS
jgi:hypothetical protein